MFFLDWQKVIIEGVVCMWKVFWLKNVLQSIVYVFSGLAEGNNRGSCLHVENILVEENSSVNSLCFLRIGKR
jgi:hypothetical protein